MQKNTPDEHKDPYASKSLEQVLAESSINLELSIWFTEEEKIQYSKLHEIYSSLFKESKNKNILADDFFAQLKTYRDIYKDSSNRVQSLLDWRLEKLLSKCYPEAYSIIESEWIEKFMSRINLD